MRKFLSNSIFALGLWIAPRAFGAVMVRFLEATPRFLEQMESGREGGVVIIPWGISDDGMKLARLQTYACQYMAEGIRDEFEKEKENAQII